MEHAIAVGAFLKFLICKIPQVAGPFFYNYNSTQTYTKLKKLPGNEKKTNVTKYLEKSIVGAIDGNIEILAPVSHSKIDCFSGKQNLFLLSKLNLAFNNCFPVIFTVFQQVPFLL